jgi:exonuclease SbcC
MRPKILEIEGLQSYTDTQVIDFETLGETGLFGIFGPTGSGKSTILDAITFALYGRVKRAENGTQGIINSRCGTARVSFTFELDRGGTRKIYRVERTYRKKKKSPGSCEPKVARLIEVTEEGEIPLCDRATEVTSHVTELLGLNRDDFTRAVVLPQNSFHEFLMLKNLERRAMLERIFYLEEYGKLLTERITRKMASLRRRMDVLTGELMGYGDASDEVLEEAEAAMEAALKEKKETGKELKKLEKIYNESREVWGLVSELEDLCRKEDSHRQTEAEISEKRTLLDRAVSAGSLADMIKRNRELEAKLSEAKKQLEEVMAVLPGVREQLAGTKSEYERVKRDAASSQQKLVEQRTRLRDAMELKAEVKALDDRISELQGSVSGIRNTIGSKSAEIGQETARLDGLERRLRELAEESEKLRVEPEYRQKMQQCAALEKDVVALDRNVNQHTERKARVLETIGELEKRLAGITGEIAESLGAQKGLSDSIKQHESDKAVRDSMMRSIEELQKVRGIYQVLELKENEAEASRNRAEKLKEALGEQEAKAAELEKVEEEAARFYEECRRKLDECRQELEKNTAWLLSKNLKAGEPCPVCGSPEHPAPAVHSGSNDTDELEKKTEEARQKLEEAEAVLKEAERKVLVCAEKLKAVSEQLDQAVKDHGQKSKDVDDERQKLPDEWRALGIGQIRSRIEEAEVDIKNRQEKAVTWEAELAGLRESFEKQGEELSKLRMEEKSIQAELRVNRENLAQLEAELDEAAENLRRVRQELAKQLQGHTVASAAAELSRLTENDRRLEQMETETRKTRKAAEETKARINSLGEERGRLEAERIKLEAEISGLVTQKKEKEKRLHELSHGVDIEEGLRQIDSELERLEQADKQYSLRIEQLEGRFNELNMERSRLESSVNLYSDSLSGDRDKLEKALAENGFGNADEAESCMLPKERQKAIRAEIDAYDQESVNMKAQRRLLEKKLGSRSITEEEWNRTEQSYRELLERSNKSVSDYEVAKSKYDNISRKHDKWKEIRKALADVSHKHGLFDQIQKLLSGARGKENSFIDYIAEERLRYIAAKASTLLEVMTRHRYTLELDAESGFIVRDSANGGIHRMVTTLSGGEIFMTSLSLALALSEQIQLKGQSPLEFFFLDEGFGTLDQKLLDLVMDSLERLCSDDRVIGIISHVPELRQRMGRCLIVTPPTFEGTGSQVRLERS